MRYLLIIVLILFFTIPHVFGQNRAVIKGRIIDSAENKPMEFATVAVLSLKDTTYSIVSYMVTDKKGEFALHNLPGGVKLKVLVSSAGYQPVRRFMTLDKTQTVDIGTIMLSSKMLGEVTITGERPPIVIKKDTIEFNAEAFKVRPNAVVEDLLKKLPGIEVSNDGTIEANGKAVSKVLVDGREFFSYDPRIATKNLDADLIDKVQVYDDRENDPDHLIPDVKVKKIINLKFKKKLKKSIFGKVYGGAGTEDRYTAGGLFNMFRDTLQVSILAQGNNLNNTNFSISDLYENAGVNRGGSEAIYRGGFGSFGTGASGIERALSSGININDDYGKKLKINLVYTYGNNHTESNSISNNQRFLGDTDLVSNSVNSRVRTATRHYLSANVRMQPTDATTISYQPNLSIDNNQSVNSNTGSSFSNFVSRINQTTNTDNSSGDNLQFSHAFSYNHQFAKKGESISISQNVQLTPTSGVNYSNNYLTSYIASFPSYVLNRQNNTLGRNTDVSISAGYRYPIGKKLVLNVTAATGYNHNVNNSATYDLDTLTHEYDSFLQILSGNLTRNTRTESLTPGITYNFARQMQLTASLNTQLLNVNNQFDRGFADINQNYFNALPSIQLNLSSVSLGYSRSFALPNIGDMIPYQVVFSPLYSVVGNPDLKPALRNNFNIYYSNYIGQRQLNFYLNGNASFEDDGVFRQRTLNALGAETSTPINTNGRYTISTSGSISKRFKKTHDISLRLSQNLMLSTSHNFFELNRQDGYQNSYNISLTSSASFNWKDIIELDPSYTLYNSTAKYTGINYSNVSNTTHHVGAHFNVYWPAHVNFEGNYDYAYNPLVAPGFRKSANLLSISGARSFLKKDRGEIKISCYDILNQAIGTNRYVFENAINDTQSQILNRYFLLTLQFKFNKSTVKEPEKPAKKSVMPGQLLLH